MLSLSDIVNVKVGIGKGVFEAPGATVIGGASKTFDQLIKSLFSNNEVGFAYDPNDLTTLYQDAAGTVPVTAAGQPVGLMLDKSKGLVLGTELITNGAFDSGINGWNSGGAVISHNNGTLRAVGTGSGTGVFSNGFSVVAGATYQFAFRVKGDANYSSIQFGLRRTSDTGVYVSTYAIPSITTGYTTIVVYVVASVSASDAVFFCRFAGTEAINIDNASVRKLSGNHAYQTVSAMRPLLVATPQRLDYDAVDDKLITNLPAQLTGCTVVRSVPNVGTQILTNQTIPTPYNDNTDHCGLIVINRALTTAETTQITQLFNKAAGV